MGLGISRGGMKRGGKIPRPSERDRTWCLEPCRPEPAADQNNFELRAYRNEATRHR